MRLYPTFFKLFFASMDPEKAHHIGLWGIQTLKNTGITRVLKHYLQPHPDLQTTAMGLTFPSPFGIAAGFDKGGKAIPALAALGFGHIEIGTVTAQAQPGNPQPRLFRLIEDKAVINRMGFNNDGAAAVGPRVAAARADLETEYPAQTRPLIGVNIGKTKTVELDNAIDDPAPSHPKPTTLPSTSAHPTPQDCAPYSLLRHSVRSYNPYEKKLTVSHPTATYRSPSKSRPTWQTKTLSQSPNLLKNYNLTALSPPTPPSPAMDSAYAAPKPKSTLLVQADFPVNRLKPVPSKYYVCSNRSLVTPSPLSLLAESPPPATSKTASMLARTSSKATLLFSTKAPSGQPTLIADFSNSAAKTPKLIHKRLPPSPAGASHIIQ